MARLPENSQLIRRALPLALLASVLAVPMHSQSTNANSVTETKPPVNPSSQESMQPPAVDPKAGPAPPASAEQTRKAQIEADTKKLFQLSAELRAEVFKTYKESLSVTVLKKAEEVETLAKSLRILMSKEAASSH